MMHYSVQPRDRIFVKSYWLLSFAKNMAKNIGKNISKNLSSECSQNCLGHIKKPATGALKTSSKKQFMKHYKQLVIWLVVKLPIELQKSQKLRNRIIQKQIQMKMVKSYLKICISRRKTENYWWSEINIVVQ